MQPSSRAGRVWLLITAAAYLAANLTHGVGHVRQRTAPLGENS